MKSYSTKNGRIAIVREAIEEDARALTDVVNSVASEERYIVTEKSREDWDKAVSEIREKKRGLLIVAQVDGKVVGMAHLTKGKWEKNRHVGFLGMVILKGFREIGIGTAMMDYMMGWAIQERLEKISLSVFSTNERAIRLYEKFGFKLEGTINRQYKIEGKYVDELFMRKFLT
jgi:hypothetical protein